MQAGSKLWVTDGTPQNTHPVTIDINAAQLRTAGGQLFFIGQDTINGSELWVSDGTLAGTNIVADIGPGSASGKLWYVIKHRFRRQHRYFAANDSTHGLELWKTAGLSNTATLVKDIFPGISPSGLTQITGWNGRVFFTATDGLHGRELFVSNGTAAGTEQITTLNPTGDASFPYWFRIFQDRLFFSANDGLHGFEPWSSDGTSTGTALLKDVFPGVENSYPFFEAATSSDLFFWPIIRMWV